MSQKVPDFGQAATLKGIKSLDDFEFSAAHRFAPRATLSGTIRASWNGQGSQQCALSEISLQHFHSRDP